MWPWVIGGLVALLAGVASQLDKPAGEGEGEGEGGEGEAKPKAPDLDKLKARAFADGQSAAKAEFEIELKRRDELARARKAAVDEYRLGQINHQPRGD